MDSHYNKISKKNVQKFIKAKLESILIRFDPKMDKKIFKKCVKKAGKILTRTIINKKITDNPIEVINAPNNAKTAKLFSRKK